MSFSFEEHIQSNDPLTLYNAATYFSKVNELSKAYQLYARAANLGHDLSEVTTALSLIHGTGVDENCQEGFTRLKDLADNRNSPACVELGKLYRDGIPDFLEKNYHYALFYFKRADRRDGDVQYYIGMLYDQGHDESKFPVNYIESAIWLDRAATEYSSGEARYRLGIKYWKGIGFVQDYYEAKNWFCQAGHCGKYEAYYYIGKCFFHGLGGRKDMERVVHYLEQYILLFPKNQVSGEVEFMLGFAYYAGDGFLLSANNRKALKHFRNAIACNYKSAYYYAGVIYEGCRGVSQDLNAAVHYLEQSGTKRAYMRLGNLFHLTYSSRRRDDARALEYYKKALELGEKDAQLHIDNILNTDSQSTIMARILSAKQLSATKSENASKQNTATDTEKKDAASEHNVTLVEEQQKTAPTQATLTQNVPPKEKETTENPKPVENTGSNKSNSDSNKETSKTILSNEQSLAASEETSKQKQQEQQLSKEGDSSSNDVTANKEEKKNATESKEEIETIPTDKENTPLLIDTEAVKEQTAAANENQSLAPDGATVTCQTSMEHTIIVLVEALRNEFEVLNQDINCLQLQMNNLKLSEEFNVAAINENNALIQSEFEGVEESIQDVYVSYQETIGNATSERLEIMEKRIEALERSSEDKDKKIDYLMSQLEIKNDQIQLLLENAYKSCFKN